MKPHSQETLENMCWELFLGLKTISVAQCFARSKKEHLDYSYIFKDKRVFCNEECCSKQNPLYQEIILYELRRQLQFCNVFCKASLLL